MENIESVLSSVDEVFEKEQKEQINKFKEKFKELNAENLKSTLGLTIKKDNENKIITFLCQLSSYTEDNQFNIIFNAPSSSGKSYIPTEIAKLFPSEDVMEVAYCSPTAFFHDSGVYNEERKSIDMDLSKKILIFLDQPHAQLLERLRPLLSHDKKEILVKISDKTGKGGLKTRNIYIKGFPSVIFCSANTNIDEQESTRSILLSPEINQEKLRESILEKIKYETNKDTYKDFINQNQERILLKERILEIKKLNIKDIKIADEELIIGLFFKGKKILKPRHQRDIARFISIIKSFALLNCFYREKSGDDIIASYDDIESAMNIWQVVSESQEYNISPYLYGFYKEIILPLFLSKNKRGILRKEVLQKYFEVYEKNIPDWQLRQSILPALENSGLIYQEQDETNKRKILIYCSERENKEIIDLSKNEITI